MRMSGRLKLKVCGMRDAENISAIASLRPDYMGFIFFDKSPRWVGPEFTMPELPESIKKAGVFVNASNEEMLKAASTHKLDVLQLHGSETVEQLKGLAGRGPDLWKVFAIDEHFDFQTLDAYVPYVSMFLFDTKGKYYGGNAKTFDWSILQKYNQRSPFLLSGGLNAMNVSGVRGLTGMNIHGIDLNSGIEAAAGVKDSEKLRAVISEMEKIDDYN